MKIASADMTQVIASVAKGGEEKKEENGDLFALLLAALTTVQTSPVQQVVPNTGQQVTVEGASPIAPSRLQSLLSALPDGLTIEQLLMQIPKTTVDETSEVNNTAVVSESEDAVLEILNMKPEVASSESTKEQSDLLEPLELIEAKEVEPEIPIVSTQASTTEGTSTVLEITQATESTTTPIKLSTNTPLPVQPDNNSPIPQSVPKENVPVSVSLDTGNNKLPAPADGQAPVTAGPSTPIVTNVPAEISPESLQQLRTEVVTYSNNPSRPSVTLEITPPEYGRVMVRAETTPQGQVTIRLVVETPLIKEAVLQQLPPALAGSTATPTTVAVYTAEEYQEFTEERQKGNQSDRERRQRQRREIKEPRQVEFVI